MPILSLIAKLGLDKTGFDAGMTAAGKSANKFGAGLKSQIAGAFGAAAFVSFTKSIIDMGGEIKDAADRLGVGVIAIQQFGLAAKLGGQDMSTFVSAVEKLRIAMTKGENPLEVFGITMKELRGGDAVGILKKLAVNLGDLQNNAEKTAALRDVFGKGFGPTVNMLRELQNTTDGTLFFSEKEIELLDRAGDAMTRLWHNAKVLAASLFFHPVNPLQRGADAGKSPLPPTGGGEETLAAREEAAKAHMATQDRILAIEKETAQLAEQTRISQLTKEERLTELVTEREKLFSKIATTEEERAQKALNIVRNEAAIVALDRKSDKKSKGFNIEESALGRIGAFTGASAAAGLASPQAAQLATMQKIYDALVSKGIIIKDVVR